jgi:hypothetical protein
MFLPIYYECTIKDGGYKLSDDGHLVARFPDAQYKTKRFTSEAVIKFIHVYDCLGTEYQDFEIIKFSNHWGPLLVNYKYDFESDHIATMTGIPPRKLFKGQMENFLKPVSKIEEGTIEIIQAEHEGAMIPHVRPPFLIHALHLAFHTVGKNQFSVCEFKKKYRAERPRRTGVCPPGCLINNRGGKKLWGDGCQQYVKTKQLRKQPVLPKSTNVVPRSKGLMYPKRKSLLSGFISNDDTREQYKAQKKGTK